MDVVSGIEFSAQPARIGGVSRRGVEIDDGVELTAAADPMIDLLAHLFPSLGVGGDALERSERTADDGQAMQMRTANQQAIACDDVLCAGLLAIRQSGNG